jgi:hypothetical protein
MSDIEPAACPAENCVDENSTAAGPAAVAELCCVAEAIVEAAEPAPLVAAVFGALPLQAVSSNENVTAKTAAKDSDRIARIVAPSRFNN